MVMLTRWNPTRETSNLTQRMERLFDEMVGRGLWRDSEERSLRGSWMPAINILEREDAMVITADLPGLKAEDVEVTVEEGTLSIRGERKLEEAAEGEAYHRVEELFRLAADDSLRDPEVLEAEVVRMVDDQRADRFVDAQGRLALHQRSPS